MNRRRRSPFALPVVALAGMALAALPAQAATSLAFSTPVKLLGASGGEPSIATDGKGNVYVISPQGIPSGLNQSPGAALWISHDHAASFGSAVLVGSYLGGGDSDVQVAPDDGSVGILDLEAVASAVCFSHDHGATFESASPIPDPTNCQMLPTGQAGPSDDREWLTLDKGGRAYVTYHEFVSAQPLIFRTDSFGQDAFTAGPCGPIITDPTIEANVPQDVTGGTLISKPVLDSKGNLYILFTTTTQQQNAANLPGSVSGTFSQIYLAVSKDNCASFTDHTVFDGSALGTNTVQFGDIFNDLAIDGAGNLYALGAGYVDTAPPAAPTADVFLFSSTDGGQTWTGPRQVNTDRGAHMLPAAVGGPQAGQLAIGYFRTTNGVTNPNDSSGTWTYTVTESTNAADAKAANFVTADAQTGRIFHSGDICNSGILCGTPAPGAGSDRSLVDFTQATVDGDGCPIFAFAGNPDGDSKGTNNFVSKQTSGCFPTTVAATTTQSTTSTSGGGAVQPAAGTPNTSASLPSLRIAGIAATGVVGLVMLARRRRRREL